LQEGILPAPAAKTPNSKNQTPEKLQFSTSQSTFLVNLDPVTKRVADEETTPRRRASIFGGNAGGVQLRT
jgi:hypothetical protein